MKKLIIAPAVALTLMGTAMLPSADAFGWPFSKKNKAEPTTEANPTADSATDPAAEKQGHKFSIPKLSTLIQQGAKAPTGPSMPLVEANPAIPRVQVKSPLTDEVNDLKVEEPVESLELPPDKTYVTVDDPSNPLGVTTSAEKLNTSAMLISQKRYPEAQKALAPLKDWLVDATEAHINLHKTLKAIPSAQVQAELEKQLALQFALLRDKAFFQLGMLGVAQSDYSTAVKNLSRVIQSQPRSPMGAQAYDVLQKIGFTEKIQLREDRKDNSQVGNQTAP